MAKTDQVPAMGLSRSQGPIGWAEQGLVPDGVIRAGIRRLNRQRLADIHAGQPARSAANLQTFIEHMREAPVALVPELANEQHYEVPADFFAEVMGVHRKYSCCHWTPETRDLGEAERDALRITCERAGLADGMDILELGCG